MSSYWVRVNPTSSMTEIFIRKGKFEHRDTGGNATRSQGKIGKMPGNNKDCQKPPKARKSFHQSPQTLDFRLLPSRVENEFLLLEAIQFMTLCYCSPSKLIQWPWGFILGVQGGHQQSCKQEQLGCYVGNKLQHFKEESSQVIIVVQKEKNYNCDHKVQGGGS